MMTRFRKTAIAAFVAAAVSATAAAPASASTAEPSDSAELNAVLAVVPDEYAVDAANADSLAAQILGGSPLEVLTPTGTRDRSGNL